MREPRPSGHRRLVRTAVAACAALALAAFIAGVSADPALAVTCSGGAMMTIDLASGESVALSLSGGADPLGIVVMPSDPSCGGFDTSTVTTIRVNGTGGNESVTIDQSGSAPFPHQNTVSIDLALGDGTDSLVINGQSTADAIGFGTNGISLDAGGTPDVTGVATVEGFIVNAGGGDDTVSGKEGGGLGGDFATTLTINGEEGDDALTGGDGNDVITGGNGNDTLDAGADGDTVDGDAGADTLSGGEGSDTVNGGEANDKLKGGGNDDDVNGDPGRDELAGGHGHDHCIGGPDPDSITGCERGHP